MIRYFCDWCERETPPGKLADVEWLLVGAQRKEPILDGTGHRMSQDPNIARMRCTICDRCKHAVNLPAAEANAIAWLQELEAGLKAAALQRMRELQVSAPATASEG